MIESDFYGFGDDWIVIGLALYATTFLAGLLFLGPESGRVGKLTAEGSPEAGHADRLRLVFLARLDLVLLFLIVYDMTVKPDFGDVGVDPLGRRRARPSRSGLVYWRYRVATRAGRRRPRRRGPSSRARRGACRRRRDRPLRRARP